MNTQPRFQGHSRKKTTRVGFEGHTVPGSGQYPDRRVIHPVGVKQFNIDGNIVHAINERNAIRKSKKVA